MPCRLVSALACALVQSTALAAPPAGPPATDTHAASSWEALPAVVDSAVAEGFEGVVLLVRDGNEVVRRAVGMANREAKVATSYETVFAIGSTPIDFTKVAILKLVSSGKVALSDPVSKFFPSAPEDKRGITVEQLMTGRSGMQDFFDLPTDRDPDHSWIDREEALRRMFAQKLLFEPGAGSEHSHAAFVLLAAIVEVVSNDTYPAFLRREVLAPAGMRDTAFFGEPIPADRLAIGYGIKTDGATNAPPHWGTTSWLVMGSGGMTSTVGDMRRWFAALRSEAFVDQALASRFLPRGSLLAGGDMYGFEIMTAESGDSLMIVVSNAISSRDRRQSFQRLGERLGRAVLGEPEPPRFAIGVEFEATEDRIVVRRVVPGGPAEAAGLKAGDAMLAANGVRLTPEPRAVLGPLLESGAPITFEIEREGERRTVIVTPAPPRG